MIRYTHINHLVLCLYKLLPTLRFPIDIAKIIDIIPNCRYMSYQRFAEVNHCSVDDVIQICESESGCTHYDILKDRYLILCNQPSNGSIGRQRWTCGHEIGHVLCKHHSMSAFQILSNGTLPIPSADPNFESEADYFSATLLAPFPLFNELKVHSTIDVQNTFGLSAEASLYRYKQYIRWVNSKTKTSWENDMIKAYKQKNN